MRMYYEATTAVAGMWYGNPVLTCVIFGLPFGFLSLICYSIFCADIMDAAEDDEEPSKVYSFFLFPCNKVDSSSVVVAAAAAVNRKMDWSMVVPRLINALLFLFVVVFFLFSYLSMADVREKED